METILCPVDLSSVAELEIRLAGGLCSRFGARLIVQHCIAGSPPPGLGMSWMFAEEHERARREESERTRKMFRDLFQRLPAGVRAEGLVAYGPLDRLLFDVADSLPADLIVMATHGPGTIEHGSTTERLILDAPCPVLATRSRGSEGMLPDFAADDPIRTLVPVDFSPTSRRALDHAAALCRRLPLELHVLYVDDGGGTNPPEIEKAILISLPDEVAERTTIEIVQGLPIDGILQREEELEARLMIMGTQHKGWIERLVTGSVSRELLHVSPCPVWFVPERARAVGVAV